MKNTDDNAFESIWQSGYVEHLEQCINTIVFLHCFALGQNMSVDHFFAVGICTECSLDFKEVTETNSRLVIFLDAV